MLSFVYGRKRRDIETKNVFEQEYRQPPKTHCFSSFYVMNIFYTNFLEGSYWLVCNQIIFCLSFSKLFLSITVWQLSHSRKLFSFKISDFKKQSKSEYCMSYLKSSLLTHLYLAWWKLSNFVDIKYSWINNGGRFTFKYYRASYSDASFLP